MRRPAVALIALMLALGACGGGGGEGAADLEGEALFAQTTLEGQAGCSTCHSPSPGRVIVGPSLANIGAEAGSRVAGMSAEEYIRESILDPSAYVVEGFPDGQMPSVWGDVLSDAQITALIDYLLTLRG